MTNNSPDNSSQPAVLPPGGNPYIYGLHDKGGEQLMQVDGEARGWVLVIEPVGGDPDQSGTGDFTDLTDQGFGVLVRLNQSFDQSGTIPLEQDYAQFAQQAADFVARSRGAHRWIIGNEMNLEREQPRHPDSNEVEPITPRRYAACYTLCRQAIRALAGHENDQVLTGPIGPWNVQTPYPADPEGDYPANPLGDWNQYLHDLLAAIGPDNCDGIALHTYSHGYDPDLIFSEVRMDPPFDNYRFHFRAYRDQMAAIPPEMRHLPVYITETNGHLEPDGSTWPFGNNGWIKNAYQEINNWNLAGNQLIHCLVLFRWQLDEFGWSIENKPGVQQDFREAVERGYRLVIARQGGFYALNTDPLNPKGDPSAEQLLELGVQSARFSYKGASTGPEPDPGRVQFYGQRVEMLSNAGLSTLIIMTGESLSGAPAFWSSDAEWDAYIPRFAERTAQLAQQFGQWQPAWQIWNEPDLLNPTPFYDPRLRPAVFGRMLNQCYQALKAVDPTLTVVAGGLVSGHPTWLQEVINSLGGNLPADVLGIHPYDQRPEPDWPSPDWRNGYVGDFIDAYRQVTTLPQWVTEVNTDIVSLQPEFLRRFYGTLRNQFSAVVQRLYWFCYSDGMVPPFGLLDNNQQPKASYRAYQETAAIPVPPPTVKTYSVHYLSHNTPMTMVMGRTSAVQISLRNTGNWTWPAGGNHPVHLGYRWYTPDGEEVPPTLWDDNRTVLPFDLPPGQSVSLTANLAAPRVAGFFELRWDLVEEMRTWFSWQGAPTLNVSVEVTPETPIPPGDLQVSASHNNVSSGPDNLLQAIDGNPGTRWSSQANQRPGMWFQIDLGQVRTIGQVRLDNDGSPMDFPRGYRVQLSTGGNSWTTIAENANNDRPLNVTFTPRSARYVRIEQTGSSDRWWWSIHEVDISTQVRPTVRSSHNNVFTGPNNLTFAIDGNITTRWTTRTVQQPGMWFEIDLNESKLVNGLKLDSSPSPNDYPRGYVIRLSLDRQDWVDVAGSPDNSRSVNVNFNPRLARYIMIEQTGSSDRWWWAIHEIEVKSDQLSLSATASHHNVITGIDNILQAFDGKPGTRWSSQTVQRPGMWFEIDLNRTRTINGLRLDSAGSPNDYPRGYVVRLSQDRQQWDEVARNPNNDRELDLTFAARPARYIRIEQTGSSNAWWWSIHEIVVRSNGGELSTRASHNNALVGPDNLTQALDGLPQSRWSTLTRQQPGMWFELDLGETRSITGLALDNSPSPQDYPRGYVVSISEDRQSWAEMARRANNTGPLDVTFAARPARYIRIEQTGSSDGWWWSIHGITVKE